MIKSKCAINKYKNTNQNVNKTYSTFLLLISTHLVEIHNSFIDNFDAVSILLHQVIFIKIFTIKMCKLYNEICILKTTNKNCNQATNFITKSQ